MQLLTAINGILPVLGEHTVTSVTAKNPALNIILPSVQFELENATRAGFWFNRFDTTLYPDSEKAIALGSDTMSFIPKYVSAIQRGLKLFNPETQTYLWDAPVEGSVIKRVEFDGLPESVASYVFYTALVTAYATDIGLEGSIRLWQQKAIAAMGEFTREHLRNMKYSTSNSPRFQRLRAAMRAY